MSKPKLYMSEAWLRLQYLTNKKSVEQIAKECGVAKNTIRTQLKKHGLVK